VAWLLLIWWTGKETKLCPNISIKSVKCYYSQNLFLSKTDQRVVQFWLFCFESFIIWNLTVEQEFLITLTNKSVIRLNELSWDNNTKRNAFTLRSYLIGKNELFFCSMIRIWRHKYCWNFWSRTAATVFEFTLLSLWDLLVGFSPLNFLHLTKETYLMTLFFCLTHKYNLRSNENDRKCK
jgi:hypothetical protein